MAIEPTGAIYKALEYDGVSSRTYGVYITGEAVYNAPERDVEMITIPGRNGAFALDNGRFENIEVTYRAGIYADTESDFAQAVSEFRNYLCSKRGYCRLSDEYNPSEYRMAVYKSGLEVNSKPLRAGEFDITFECKPQRFLISGETAVPVASGGTITNPTLFESKPLIAIEGVGKATVNGTAIKIYNSVVGDEIVIRQKTVYGNAFAVNFPNIYIATTDQIVLDNAAFSCVLNSPLYFASQSVSNITGNPTYLPIATSQDGSFVEITCRVDGDPTTYSYGTAHTNTIGFDVSVTNTGGESTTFHIDVTTSYDGQKQIEIVAQVGRISNEVFYIENPAITFSGNPSLIIHSTAATFGNPTYIDSETGEAYTINSGVISSLNRYVQLGAKLPVLKVGSNAVSYDNTVTTLKITPRWWKV